MSGEYPARREAVPSFGFLEREVRFDRLPLGRKSSHGSWYDNRLGGCRSELIGIGAYASLVLLAASHATAEPRASEAQVRAELVRVGVRLAEVEAILESLLGRDEQPTASLAVAEPPASARVSQERKAIADDRADAVGFRRIVRYAEPDYRIANGAVSSGGQPIRLSGLIDTYYSYNASRPSDQLNTLYYNGSSATGYGLNQAKLEIDAVGNGPMGFHADLWFGSGARLFRASPDGPGPLQDLLYVQEAYGYHRFRNGAQFDMGALVTLAGLEVADSHRNWNYSRGILWAWNEPSTHLGARFSAPLSDSLTSTVMLVNGFDISQDTTFGKSYGLQSTFAPNDRFNTTLTWIHGPERTERAAGWLKNLSWNFYGGLHERLEVMANLDYIQDGAAAGATSWGLGGYARAHLSDRIRVAYRFEFFDDTEARATGVMQNLRENTFTLEIQFVKDDPRFLTRAEYRRDWSDEAFFACTRCDESGFAKDQKTFTVGFMWILGPKE